MSKVSIVLPTYNGAKFLRGSIESCLNQTHRDLELILVDDCSTDSTPAIMSEYAQKDARVKVIRNKANQRLPRSLNIGFAACTGDILTWTSDDNEYTPESLEKMLAVFKQQPKVDFVYADYWAVYEEEGRKEHIQTSHESLAQKNNIGACYLYTRRVYEKLGDYNPNLEMVEDYDYWMRVFKHFKMARLAEPVYLYRFHGGSLTTTRKFNQDLFDVILKFRNGYLPASKLGWTGAYYFRNVEGSSMTREEKDKLLKQTLSKIKGLSLPFYVFFKTISFMYSQRIKN